VVTHEQGRVPAPDLLWQALAEIEDPELPIAITDLGLVHAAALEDGNARVELLPTFTGCPALDVIRDRVRQRLLSIPGVERAEVVFVFEPPWTVERMSQAGRTRLREHGMSVSTGGGSEPVVCPVCGSANTALENAFGPTLCRAIYYCRDCRNPIERFKSPGDALRRG
jgi:ring-1,2-phenylacetyl-CoA epoxidase subunit PaaD